MSPGLGWFKKFIDALLGFSDCFCFFLRSCVWNLDLTFCFCDASVSYGNDFDRNALVSQVHAVEFV